LTDSWRGRSSFFDSSGLVVEAITLVKEEIVLVSKFESETTSICVEDHAFHNAGVAKG
jgi:hypothetical protein